MCRVKRNILSIICLFIFQAGVNSQESVEDKINALLAEMTLAEKIGQMSQFNGFGPKIPDDFKNKLRKGLVGSVLNEVNPETVNEMQRIAVEESRLQIPLIIGRDVIHGFKTILPIPLGQAATWNPDLIEQGARMAATEAASVGINWTFAPMIDITRDPRWGRIAESLGEDPWLNSRLAEAMIHGFQGNDLKQKGTIAACAKHFAGYGAAEGGRDYNTASIPENELRDVYLPPFKAAVDAGVATFMSAFNEVNGVPASGNKFLLDQILRREWGFDGFVVSDWASVEQLAEHGFAEDKKESAELAIRAGVDMEMASTTYADYCAPLVAEGKLSETDLDEAVRRILRIKFQLGLFENPYTNQDDFPEILNENHRALAKKAAVQSVVLLQNNDQRLPLSKANLKNVAVIGPLADAPHEQLGTWIPDGEARHAVTPLTAIRNYLNPQVNVHFAHGLDYSRSKSTTGFGKALEAAQRSDVILLFLGEESILSGEAHCRADISLPGAQEALVSALHETGKPIVAVIMAGRPLTIRPILPQIDALLYAWHPGTMGGPALSDLIFGIENPSGKLPVTFPTTVGQIPIYYAHKNTGKPPTKKSWVKMEDIPVGTTYIADAFTAHYLDEGFEPLFPFGFGLSYTSFKYADIRIPRQEIEPGEIPEITVNVSNTGKYAGEEVVQLYIRDLVGDRTRPVRELKGFKRIALEPGQTRKVHFKLNTDALAFHNRKMQKVTEPGQFRVWIGGDSKAELSASFTITE